MSNVRIVQHEALLAERQEATHKFKNIFRSDRISSVYIVSNVCVCVCITIL